MIRRIVVLRLCAVLLSVCFASAADLTGTWKGKIEINGESVDLTYNLKADGDKLTGTAEGPAGKIELGERQDRRQQNLVRHQLWRQSH